MRDDTRADILFSALAGERQLPDDQEFGELRALADLGAQLEALGPAMAALSRADDAFDPSFAAGLHRTLLAAHPAIIQPESVRADSSARRAAGAVRRISRRMLTLALVALALAAAVVITILHGAQQTAPVGTGVLSATATTVTRTTAGVAPSVPPAARRGPGFAPNTPKVRTFSGMARRPATGTQPTPARTDSGAAPATAGGTHGLASGSTPPGTSTPEQAQAATVPGPATPTAIHTSTTKSRGPKLGAAGIQPSTGGATYRYQLPERTPSQPGKVPVYRLRLTALSSKAAHAIVATFPGLKPLQGTNGLDFADPDEHLQITPTTGEIVYTRLVHAVEAAPPAPAPSTALALGAARDWLRRHGQFPTHAGPLTTTVTSAGIWTTVHIMPALHPALLATAQIPAITAIVDPRGVVTNAHIRWATVESVGTAALISPSAATQASEKARTTATASGARGGPPQGQAALLFTVSRITLAYQPTVEGTTLVLRPVYLLRGTLKGRPLSQTVAAEAR
ncbi:MAG TPA: hypothetical protein VIJ28_03760 [Chloroflexota bacterium]